MANYAHMPPRYQREAAAEEFYQLQQAQVELQKMQLYNLGMQERILQAAQAQRGQQLMAAVQQQGGQLPRNEGLRQQERVGPLVNLQRPQQGQDVNTISPPGRSPRSRLSFGAVEGQSPAQALAASALARQNRRSLNQLSPESHASLSNALANTMSTPKTAHQRDGSDGSEILSEVHARMTSPVGVDLVLSRPGEVYQSPSADTSLGSPFSGNSPESVRSHRPASRHSKRTSQDSTDSSGRDSILSERNSMDSIGTSVSSGSFTKSTIQAKVALDTNSSALNPAAADFTPVFSYNGTGHGSAPLEPSPVFYSAHPTRTVSPGSLAKSIAAVASRQPHGPAKEEDMAALNFAKRVRRNALNTLIQARPPLMN